MELDKEEQEEKKKKDRWIQLPNDTWDTFFYDTERMSNLLKENKFSYYSLFFQIQMELKENLTIIFLR
jgi:hypothetical protein